MAFRYAPFPLCIHRQADKLGGNSLSVMFRCDRGVVDIGPAPVISAQDRADDFPAGFAHKTLFGIAGQIYLDIFPTVGLAQPDTRNGFL